MIQAILVVRKLIDWHLKSFRIDTLDFIKLKPNINKNTKALIAWLDDSYSDELKFIVSNTHIIYLDLSHNELGPKGMEIFWNILKSYLFQIIRLVQITMIVQLHQIDYIVLQFNILTYIICVQMDSKLAMKIINQQQIKIIKECIIQDSIIQDMQNLSQSLSSLQCHLTELKLKYCFLTSESISILSQGLANNQSLIYLNLQHNSLLIYPLNDINKQEHNQLRNDFIQIDQCSFKEDQCFEFIKIGLQFNF
ncbi:unnamed protein product (macronuclear) [Paramecium tetraurelia]|uniref:Uncharacterized protein n=1 Tax=Paramecium tetraurelia TaxID=5888 RepID=A0DMX2_PARTE|nr:uncharacterized protein GSPATT00018594001 [Paramecium tetraurelia]CAK84389.1 unnamed protein product [Paramecium tetraurelia]|eukprot:XP_001451786.1 hypothetical protein (macronuclear) [Paramecium tetraurelia strain d4-2]